MKIIPPKLKAKEMRRNLAFAAKVVAENVAKLCLAAETQQSPACEHGDKMMCIGAVGAAWHAGAIDSASYRFLIAVLLKEADPDEQRSFINAYGR